MENGWQVPKRTSDGFANEGMAVVGMGGCVYTMKSAWAMCTLAAAAARARRLDLANMVSARYFYRSFGVSSVGSVQGECRSRVLGM